MVSAKEESPIYNMKISSVGPGKVTGKDAIHEPTNMDLAMKLHYLKGVYYFTHEAFHGLTILNIKETLFNWLNHAYVMCGRFRRSDNAGRPYIKCNDCGVRLLEAQCDKTLQEWLEGNGVIASLEKLLVPNQVIGPELPFSPTVLIQLTRFKCGGTSVGLRWAHVLGDAYFASEFINTWGQVFSGRYPDHPLSRAQLNVERERIQSPTTFDEDPLSLKRVDPVGDHWVTANNCKMETFSLHISPTQLSDLQSKIFGEKDKQQIPPFEALCGVIWQCLAKVRDGSEPKVVTICKRDPKNLKEGGLSNGQVIDVLKADFSVAEASPGELGLLIANQGVDERRKIEQTMERDHGMTDFIIYGANLTFVNFEEADFYGLDVRGQKPAYVSYTVDGVGEKGVVVVLPAAKDAREDGSGGRIVHVTLPENQVLEVKSELKREWSIA